MVMAIVTINDIRNRLKEAKAPWPAGVSHKDGFILMTFGCYIKAAEAKGALKARGIETDRHGRELIYKVGV